MIEGAQHLYTLAIDQARLKVPAALMMLTQHPPTPPRACRAGGRGHGAAEEPSATDVASRIARWRQEKGSPFH